MSGALLLGEEVEEFADLAPSRFDIARRRGSHKVFELGKDLLDRIEVGAVRRQKEQMGLLRRGWRCALPRVGACTCSI